MTSCRLKALTYRRRPPAVPATPWRRAGDRGVRPDDYVALLEAVNAELISMYWRIGALILERQAAQGWVLG